jgi:VIT1/CCC1 family predicted Fe2+/Mn2+ transporter
MAHAEIHRSGRTGWLRAAVLGANDGVVSIASLLLGVAAGHADRATILLTGVAALVSGAMAMGAGEYVSVCSQAETEQADLRIERRSLEHDYAAEVEELALIYVHRGLDPRLAHEVARQLMARDALSAHARDDLGLTDTLRARPFQAALASAASFTVGATVPLLTIWLVTSDHAGYVLGCVSLVFLAVLGGTAARAGGANILRGVARALFWGAAAMGVTAGIGVLFGFR